MGEQQITVLSEEESWQLLASRAVGRIAVSVGDDPDIFPINYHAADGRILIRTGEGTKLSEMSVNDRVAFEVDDYDEKSGWSVVIKGTASILVATSDIAEADKSPLRPWIPTIKYNYVVITPTKISGRRFVFGPEPERYPV